jgi:hypothetical protein
MFFSAGFGAQTRTAAECYDYFSGEYGFTTGWFVNGPPKRFQFAFFPFAAVIDLNTGVVLGKTNSETDILMEDEILTLVQQANAE